MGTTKEYLEVRRLSVSDLTELINIQRTIQSYVAETMTETTFRDRMEDILTVIGVASLFPKFPYSAGVAATIAGVIISSVPDRRELINDVITTGTAYLTEAKNTVSNKDNIRFANIELPFLEFVEEKYRCVQGRGKIVSYVTNNGGILPGEQ